MLNAFLAIDDENTRGYVLRNYFTCGPNERWTHMCGSQSKVNAFVLWLFVGGGEFDLAESNDIEKQ